ncbi:hypothetical protein LF63_0107255 [Oleiagrimonas soli]|uniref:Toxin CptA n=2 Tax=Oleiagrimonas soli TaxID=1543381 RepID=A0A099CWU2_9GAMM|nr:hypothetical protein LF63_0107255 [Oleiagrimonas soli]
MSSAPSIGFDYRPSRWPVRAMAALSLLSVVAVLDSGAMWWLRLVLTMLIAVYSARACLEVMRPMVRRVQWRADGGWRLALADDSDVEARLLGMRVLGGSLVLRLGWASRRRQALLLLPDNLDADTRRRLRIRLSAESDKH